MLTNRLTQTQQQRIASDVSCHSEEAETYFQARSYMGTVENVSTVAAARLEDLLITGRREISGMFLEEEVTYMVERFRGALHAPCFMYGLIEPRDEWDSDNNPGEIEFELRVGIKVQNLTDLQRYAFLDLVERCWYRPPTDGPKLGLFEELGVKFRTAPRRDSLGRFC